MALFKILSNMTDPTKQLPLSYHQGYCYFDVKTGKFWIDTTDAAAGRMAINAYKADIATLANAAIYETTEAVNAPLHKINTYYGHGLSLDGTTLSLVAGDNNTTLSNIKLPDPDWNSITNKPDVFPPESHTHITEDVLPIKSKTFTDVIGTENNWANATFFFGSIKPTSWDKTWRIKYKIRTYVPNQTGYDQVADVILSGDTGALRAYSSFNTVTSSYPAYYHELYRLKQAGFTNGYGHSLGVRFYSAYNPTSTSYKRTIVVDILELENCSFNFYDSCLKYSKIPGTGSTNYDTYSEINYCSNGLQEAGDSNDVNYQNRIGYTSSKAKDQIYRFQLLLRTIDEQLIPVSTANNTFTIGKTYTTTPFNPFGEIYYYNGTSNIAPNGNIGDYYLYRQILADLRYSFDLNNSTNYKLVARQPVYLTATLQSDGSAVLTVPTGSTIGPLAQSLPTTEDGLIYIYLGQAYADTYPYRLELVLNHGVYYYKNGQIRQLTGDAQSVNGHTVESNVPAGAVFTDTHYTTHLYAGDGTAANKATTNGNTKISVADNSTIRNSITIKGTGATSVSSDTNGIITINSNNTTYSAGTGLSLSGTTFNHSNSVTAKTAAAQAAKTLTWGGTFTLYEEKYDSQGHITGVANYNMTMPSNPNTDYRVRQTNDTSNTNYRLLLSNSANSTQEDNITHKNDNLIYNPSTMTLKTGNLNLTGELDVVGNAYLHNETQANSLTAGSLLVTGNANFTQIPTAPTATAGTSNTQLATTEFVTGAVQTVVGPMRFMGSLGGSGATITSLPTASSSNKGYTYKVIKNGTYGTITAKAGDTVISTGSDWVLIPSGDEPSGTVTSITLKAGDGITLDTDNTAITTSGTRTISHKNTSSVTNLAANGRTYVTGLTFDTYGHVTGYTTGIETVTNTDTKVTSVGNHYTPIADNSAELTASLSGTAGSYALNTEYTVLTGIKAQRDAKGHVTGLTYTAQKIKDTNTTYTLAGLMGNTAIGSSTKPIYWTGSAFAGISSYEGNAATATKLSNTPNNTTTFLRGDNTWSNQLNGPLTLYREGTTASNAPAGITFTVKDTDKNLTSTAYLNVYNDHSTSYNTNLVLNSTGNTFIGAGESASSIYSAKGASQTGESLYLSADSLAYMYAHADTAANRIGFVVDTDGNIVPQKAEASNDNVQNLGSSNNRWKNVYATTFTGALSGNASTATNFASAQSVTLTGDVTGTASSQAGWSIATTLANSGVTANTYGNTSQQTPAHGGTFNIPYFKVDAKGRVTQAGTTTVKLPADSNTDTKVNVIKRGTSKSYILGDTTVPPDSATAHTAVAESHIYMTTTAGQISAKSYSFNDGAATPTEKAQVIYNTANGCLEIVVA